MSTERSVVRSFQALRAAIAEHLPQVVGRLRPAEPFALEMLGGRAGSEALCELWSLTGGQWEETILGVFGGTQLLGPKACAHERARWDKLLDESGMAQPTWDRSFSLDPEAVRDVYFSSGWFPVLREPLEANYLAVDLDPLPGGNPGQIILCGRDEDDKCLVCRDLIELLDRMTDECVAGRWVYDPEGDDPFVERNGGRLLTEVKRWMQHERS